MPANVDNNKVILYDTSKMQDSYKNYIDSDYFVNDQISYEPIYIPKKGIDVPKQKNYDDGYVLRYFYRQGNNKKSPVIEITSSEYKAASKYFLYKTAVIKWKIIGDVDNTRKINRNVILLANTSLEGIYNTLWNPLEYWKNIPDNSPASTNVTTKYVTKKEFETTYTVLSPSQIDGTTDYEMYLLSQDYVVLLTQDYVGLIVEDNT